MTYLASCGDAYGSDPHFQGLLSALTASEDYNAFLQVMFAAVRENWEPDEAAPPPQPDVQVHMVSVTVPEGVGPGMAMSVEYLGLAHTVVVPDGFPPGSTLPVQLQIPIVAEF